MGILKEMEQHGAYAQLSNGKVRYELAGPENAELVVLVHGLIGHMHVWDYQFNFLVEKGYRVLRFDLYGRGFSERVKGEHGSELFMAQLTDLFSLLNIEKPFHLVGLSMGGAISTRYASHHAEMVKSLFLVDCYGIPTPNDPGMLVTRPRGIGEALIGTLGGAILKRAPIKGVYDKKKHAGFAKWFSAPLAVKGSKRALLSTLRHFMLENHVPHYQRVDHLSMNKLILWGKHDRVLPLKYGMEIHALMPSAEFVVLDECGHVPQYEAPEEVNSLIQSFIEKSK